VGATQRIAAGDLSARTGLPDRYGELQLAHAVDEMAESLKRLVTEYKYAEAEIRQLNETLERVLGVQRN